MELLRTHRCVHACCRSPCLLLWCFPLTPGLAGPRCPCSRGPACLGMRLREREGAGTPCHLRDGRGLSLMASGADCRGTPSICMWSATSHHASKHMGWPLLVRRVLAAELNLRCWLLLPHASAAQGGQAWRSTASQSTCNHQKAPWHLLMAADTLGQALLPMSTRARLRQRGVTRDCGCMLCAPSVPVSIHPVPSAGAAAGPVLLLKVPHASATGGLVKSTAHGCYCIPRAQGQVDVVYLVPMVAPNLLSQHDCPKPQLASPPPPAARPC